MMMKIGDDVMIIMKIIIIEIIKLITIMITMMMLMAMMVVRGNNTKLAQLKDSKQSIVASKCSFC